jgi:hypothetical protein
VVKKSTPFSSVGLCLRPDSCRLLTWHIIRPQKWRQYFPPKHRRTSTGLYGGKAQKIIFLIITAVRTIKPTNDKKLNDYGSHDRSIIIYLLIEFSFNWNLGEPQSQSRNFCPFWKMNRNHFTNRDKADVKRKQEVPGRTNRLISFDTTRTA